MTVYCSAQNVLKLIMKNVAIELNICHTYMDKEKKKMKRKTSTTSDLSNIPTVAEFEKIKTELEELRAKLPKWHRCDKPNEDGLYDLPPESGSYFAQWETTWADGKTTRCCEPLEYDADNCDWPSLTNRAHVIQWCENPVQPEV